jgi:hypothetical protein
MADVVDPRYEGQPLRSTSAAVADIVTWWVAAIGLACLAWHDLLRGAGLIGGDIYTYFFPLKTWYAWALKNGEIPFWNPLVGHGFPTLGESQTGVFYPFHLLLYRYLEVNTAYNLSLILHYVLLCGFTCHYAASLGVSRYAALLAAVVFVYGWFPARSCLEWAAVTGAWMPGILWASQQFLRTGQWRYWLGMEFFFALQLLAGHYHLSFITLLATVGQTAWWALVRRYWWRAALGLVAFLAGLALGSVHVLSTWELKERSHRAEAVFKEGEIYYGKIPLAYLWQMVAPWKFYPRMKDQSWRDQFFGSYYTNQVEAHLYFGMLPLGLAVGALFWRRAPGVLGIWLVLGVMGLLLATAVPLVLLRHVPGFGYFTGSGRYGIMTQMAVALWAARGLDRLRTAVRRPWIQGAVLLGTGLGTWWDLMWVASQVQITRTTSNPPVRFLSRGESPLQSFLKRDVRIFGESENALTLVGVSQLPAYIGLSPWEYLDGPGANPVRWTRPPEGRDLRWLRWAGVTYVLRAEPLPYQSKWPVDLVWYFPDPAVAVLLGRPPETPIRVYRLRGARGRAYLVPASTPLSALEPFHEPEPPIKPVRDVQIAANEVIVDVAVSEPSILVLTDLDYDGWHVEVEGREAQGLRASIFRAVLLPPGSHRVRWWYRPTWLVPGLILAALVLTAQVAYGLGAAVHQWHARKLREELSSGTASAAVPWPIGETFWPGWDRGWGPLLGEPRPLAVGQTFS